MKFKRRRIFIFLAMSASLLMITPFCLFAFNQPSRTYVHDEHLDVIANLERSMKDESRDPRQTKTNDVETKCVEEVELSRCEVVHVSIVCTGFGSTRDVVTLVKSLIFHRKNRIHFHFFSDQVATRILQVLFETWMVPAVAVTFYNTDALKERVEWIPNKHYSGVNGLLKLIIPDVLPRHLDKVIVLDTDITLVADIGELWRVFQKFGKGQAIGLVDNQSHWYLQKASGVQVWPALGTGYNTGVILFDLRVMRSLGWSSLWEVVTRKFLQELHVVVLADQDVFNAVIHENPYLVHNISCSWNVQLGEKTLSETCYNKSDPKIIHWNSPKKLKVKAKNVEHFRNLFLTFLEYNGNLLRQDFLATCDDDEVNQVPSSSPASSNLSYLQQNPSKEADESDECEDFYRERLMKRRTHLYYLDYSVSLILFPTPPSPSSSSSSSSTLSPPLSSSSSSSSSPSLTTDVTLVAQLSMDRIQMLDMVASAWQGPISLALYLSDTEVHQLLKFVQGSPVLGGRRNIGYHVVFKDGQYYPINYLRNVALENVNTRFAFLSDIDFLPLTDLYDRLKQHIVDLDLTNRQRALVIPAFETERYKAEYPSSKNQLLSMLEAHELFTFRYHVWPQGQMATNYTRWKETNQPYQVSWEPNYEPFIVIDRSAPRYDERFLGFGWNKVSHIMELDAMGYEFWVVTDSFVLHLPHSPSLDIARYRSSESYRYCLRQLKEDFLKDLSKKYGLKALKYLSPDN